MKIKLIEPSVDVSGAPSVRTSPDVGVGLARGLAQMGQAMEGASQDITRAMHYQIAIDRRQRQWETETETLSRLTQFRTRLDDIHRELAQTPPDKNGDIHANWMRATNLLKSEFGTEIMASPSRFKSDIYDLFNKNITAYLGQAEISAKHLANTKWLDNEKGKLLELLNYVADKAPASGNTEGMIAAWARIAQKMRDDGIIGAVDYERMRESLRNTVDINMQKIQTEAQRQQEKAAETKADEELSYRHPGDYDAQIKALGDPQQYKKLGLTAERASNLANIIKARKAKEENKKTQAYHATAVKLFQFLRQDSLSPEMVDEAVSIDMLDLETGTKLKKAIENKYADVKVKTDPFVFSDLLTFAHTSPDRQAVKKRILKHIDGIEEADIEKLLTQAEGTYQAVENKMIADALKYIENTVIPKRGIMEKFLSTPEEQDDLKNALSDFNTRINAMRATGKELKQEDIDNLSGEVSRAYRRTIWERTQRMRDFMKQQLKPSRKPGKEGKPAEMPKRKKGETPEEYEKRTGIN